MSTSTSPEKKSKYAMKAEPDPGLVYEKHKNIIVFNGYQFSVCRAFVTKSGIRKDYWRCLECKRQGCKGTLSTVNVNGLLQIVKDSATKHCHPPDFIAVEKRKYIGLVKKYFCDNPFASAKTIYDHFRPTLTPELARLYPDTRSIKPLLRKRKAKKGEAYGEEMGIDLDDSQDDNGSIKKPRKDSEMRLYDPLAFGPDTSFSNHPSPFPDPACELYEPMLDQSSSMGNSSLSTPPPPNKTIVNISQSPQIIHQHPVTIAPPPMRTNLVLPHNGSINIANWGVEHVSYFLSCNGFQMLVPIFEENQINGIAFAEMEKSDLVNLLKIKVGHAVQLFKLIKQLRDLYNYECS